MRNGFVRKLSGLEAFFVDLDAGGCNMTFHFYLKLNHRPNVDRLRDAMKRIVSLNEAINMRFHRNAWYISSYVHECPVIEIEGNDLTSYEPCRLNYHKNTVDLKILHAILSDTWYLCFDFFHGVVDGRSGIQFIYDFFDVLNDREPKEVSSRISACEIIHENKRSDWQKCRPAFTVFPECSPSCWHAKKKGVNKTRILCNDGCLRGAAAHYSEMIGNLFGKRSAKMIIPVDIRRHADDGNKAMYGNLFVPMFLEAKKCSTWKDMHGKIIDFVKKKPNLMSVAKKLDIYSRIPTKPRQAVIRTAIPMVMSSKKFIYCALVSALGNIESEKLLCDDFTVEDYNVAFVSFPFTAFTVISLQYNGHTNTTVCWHSGRVSEDTAKALMNNINDCMVTAVI